MESQLEEIGFMHKRDKRWSFFHFCIEVFWNVKRLAFDGYYDYQDTKIVGSYKMAFEIIKQRKNRF